MRRIAIFGKGGIGKSMLAANLAAVYARQGRKVLLVGCDPKHDTTVALTAGRPIRTVVDASTFMDSAGAELSEVMARGRLGVDCVEAGGPEPGIGCAGRGISRMIEILNGAGVLRDGRHDVALFDVLGDVVCGGFAAPLRQGFADQVVIVTSEELMSLYAVNNIARAVRNYSANGIALSGLVANLRDPGADREAIARFAALLGTKVLAFLPREAAVREAEYRGVTVVEHAPRCGLSRRIVSLADELWAGSGKKARVPTPLSDESFHELSRKAFLGLPSIRGSAPSGTAAPLASGEHPAPTQRAQRLAVAGPSALEEELAGQASLWEGYPGPNSQVWGAPDQWRRFYCDFETRRNAKTGLEVDAPVVNVRHQDLECSYATPNYEDASLPAFFKFPWPPRAEPDGPGERDEGAAADDGFVGDDAMTDLRDRDIIHGGGRKLDEAIRAAVRRAEGRAQAVVVHSTCVPTVIGDDAEAVVARWRGRTKLPILYSNPASNAPCADAGAELFKRMRQTPAFAKVRRRGRSVNLVGFPEGPALGEIEGLLREAGVAVNARVMPRLGLAAARRYLSAEVQVFYPNKAYEPAYRELFAGMPIRTLRPEAPYGLEGTRSWLESLAGEFGLKRRAAAVFGKAMRGLAAAWEETRREAAGRSLAFVVDPARMGRLSDPAQSWGIPVVRLLRELGFGVEVLCCGRARKGGSCLSFFRTPDELDKLLREGRFAAVYSEYACDPRLARAGKAQFSLDCFEMGLAGALRSGARLNGICRWPFPRRYARYLGKD